MSESLYILSWFSDGGEPTLKFFPTYRAVDAAIHAAQMAKDGETVIVRETPTFDEQKAPGTSEIA